MNRSYKHIIGSVSVVIVLFCAIMNSWDAVIGFLGIALTAVIPLILGSCIAYVVSIPTSFVQRHLLPNATSKAVTAVRQPLSLLIAVVLLLFGLIFALSVLVPAFVETISMARDRGEVFIESVIAHPIMEPIHDTIDSFLKGDLMQGLANMDLSKIFSGLLGGSMANVGTQVFTMVSTVMTGFFGLLFSFILLTDTTDVYLKIMETVAEYLGPKRTEHLALIIGVTDASFHNFIVRQFIEAIILGVSSVVLLFVSGFKYALGVGVLMGLAAMIPIVGYPVGLLFGAFMIAIESPWTALTYIVVIAIVQATEATLLLPHVGDPRTVLPPVWTTVAVTIGGGVAGFLGMLVAIPLASTVRQLILIDIRRRAAARERAENEFGGFDVELPQTVSDAAGGEEGAAESVGRHLASVRDTMPPEV